jgi:hypothetical protein
MEELKFTEPQLLSKASAMLGIKMSERDARCALKFVELLREKGTDATLREIERIPFKVEEEIRSESNQQPKGKLIDLGSIPMPDEK